MKTISTMGAPHMNETVKGEPPLSDEEKRRVRALLKQDERVTWLWSTLGVWCTWGAGAAAAFLLFADHLKKIGRAIGAFFGAL